ncbi:MAG: hypothetical protein AABW89_02190 [Nanoarchaeota archaeon]
MAIERVVYLEKGDLNMNSRRRASTITEGKDNEFEISEVRLLAIDETGTYGGHYREYPEVWGFLGEAEITLEDIGTKERRKYKAVDGTRLFIPAMVASKVEAKKGTSIVTCAPHSADREKQTHKYSIA